MEYIKDWRIWIICTVIILVFCMCDIVEAKEKETFWIRSNTTVLCFLGKPTGLDLKTIKLTTYKKQEVVLFHKDSGPGIYAFFIKGLVVFDDNGKDTKVKTVGYFLAKRSQVTKDFWFKKESMKYKTKNRPMPKPKSDFKQTFKHVPESEDSIVIW